MFLNVATGKAVYRKRLEPSAGRIHASVIAADGNQLEVTVHQQGLTILTHSASLSNESDPVRTAGQAISRALFAASNSVSDLKLESAVLLGSLGDDDVDAGLDEPPREDTVARVRRL